jgi:hypothetical protein
MFEEPDFVCGIEMVSITIFLREIPSATPKTVGTGRCPQKENCVLVVDQKVAIFGKDEV